MRRLLVLCALLAGCAAPCRAGQDSEPVSPEQSVCGLKEPLLFWLWSRIAGRPDAARVAGLPGVEDIAFAARDGRVLRGYRLRAAAAGNGTAAVPRGYVLVLQGNAVLADRLIDRFAGWAAAGYDVYVYDYRGYGRSDGRRRLAAITRDYAEIIAALNRQGYERRLAYAFSFGGIVLLDSVGARGWLDRVVIDSTPGRLSTYGCPRRFDPVEHLPADCRHMLFVVGGDDTVVTPAMSRELVETARSCGATVLREPDLGHPFMEATPGAQARRLRAVGGFLLAVP
jgi:pimeloyl-ACP methyl ester carboxylesterase